MKTFWRRLLANMGIKLVTEQNELVEAFDLEGALVNALSIGRFGATNIETAFAEDFLTTGDPAPRKGSRVGTRTWQAVTSPSRDRFIFREMPQEGGDNAFAVYFSFWIKSPRALDDLLTGGPDAPRFSMFSYVSEQGRLWLNGHEIEATVKEPADYRVRYQYDGLPLKRGWNHFLMKVVFRDLKGDKPGTLALRMTSNQPEFQKRLETAIEVGQTEAENP
jgi:beta-galactosidase